MNLTRYLLPLGVASLLLGACTPYPPNPNEPIAADSPQGAGQETVSSDRQKDINRRRSSAGQESTSNPDPDPDPGPVAPPPPPKDDYPVGIRIPGKEGFVFNPYTNEPVDVRAIPAGTLVRDPQDPNPDHKFRVP